MSLPVMRELHAAGKEIHLSCDGHWSLDGHHGAAEILADYLVGMSYL